MSKSWYSRSQDIEYKDGHIEEEYYLVFETTDKELASRIEKIFHNIMDGIEPEPQVVRCKDCKHWTKYEFFCSVHVLSPMQANDFCSRAERKE